MELIHMLQMFQSQNSAGDLVEGRESRDAARGLRLHSNDDFAMMSWMNAQPDNCEAQNMVEKKKSERKMSKKDKAFKEELVTEIGADRRNRRRYDIDLDLQYKVVKHYQVCQSGAGKTVNFSASGVAFESEEGLRPGTTVELAIAWPVMLNSTCPLKLVVTGKVVRTAAKLTAVRMERYEFRTQGVRAIQARAAGYPA
jgi:hypothetical protein